MPDNKTKKKDGSHLTSHVDLCVYEIALLMGAPYSKPLIIEHPKRLTRLFLDGLIAKGLLERDMTTSRAFYFVRRTSVGDFWLDSVHQTFKSVDA